MKLLTMPRKRNFYLEDGTSSCCGAKIRKGGIHDSACACCGSELHYIGKHPRDAILFTDIQGVFVNDNEYGKRVRKAHYTSKYFIAKHGKIVRKESMESYTYNWATGRLYRVNIARPRKTVRDITYVAQAWSLNKEFIKKVIQWRAFYLFPEVDIIRDIERCIGVPDLFEYVDSIFKGHFVQSHDQTLRRILYCLAYPRYTWMKCPLHQAPSPKFRKSLKEGKNQKALYNAYFNNNVGKATIDWLSNDEIGQGIDAWWAVRFLSMFLNKGKIWDLINSGWIVHMLADKERDRDQYFDDAPLETDLTQKNVVGFTNEYGAQRLLNHIADEKHGVYGVRMYVRDSISMWVKIKEQMPDYVIPRSNSLKEAHDKLTRDSRKLTVDNEDIKYNRDEQELNSVYGNIEFRLPKDVHTIIDHGDELHICVGGAGYTSSAVKKEITLLFGLKAGYPVVCMQIQKHRLVQAKMHGNNLARNDDEVRSAIMDLCEENGIAYDSCYDLVSNVGPVGLYQQEMAQGLQDQAAAAPRVFEPPEIDNNLFPF